MLDALKVVFIFEMISAFIVIVSLYILKEKKNYYHVCSTKQLSQLSYAFSVLIESKFQFVIKPR